MPRRPRYRTGDPDLDDAIRDLVDKAEPSANDDLVFEMVVSSLRLGREQTSRGDLKIANAALKEMRHAFLTFGPYRNERKVSIFGSARTRPDDPLYEQARRFAAAIVECDWMVITGAGPGIMTAGIEGAGPENSFGVSIRLPFESAATQYLADDPKLVNFRYFFTRKLAFIKESDGFVLLPGGFGTMDEAFELLTLVQTGKTEPAPIVMLDVPGGQYWKAWGDFAQTLVEREYVGAVDLTLFRITDSVEDAVDELTGFYRNFHSIRFVDGRLVLRLQRLPDEAALADLNERFSDLLTMGQIEPVRASAAEIAEGDVPELVRLGLSFDRHSWARLRQLIDVLNSC
jgi:uncharacterized protein (TIGR00730 family)